MTIEHFSDLTQLLISKKVNKRVAVVCPNDDSTQQALLKAQTEGFIEPICFDDHDPQLAARQAIDAVKRGEVDILMKGFINTDILLHAILNKETGILPQGRVLTHITVAEMESYHKLLFFTDPAVIPYPTNEQREAQVDYIARFCRSFGIEKPKISLIHCTEKVDPKHFPYTADYKTLKDLAAKGRFGSCILDGPLDLKTSCSPKSMKVKHIPSPIAGDADALVFPDIEAGNLFYKTITLFCQARTAGVLQGTQIPVVLPSRADAPDNKYLSLCIACLL